MPSTPSYSHLPSSSPHTPKYLFVLCRALRPSCTGLLRNSSLTIQRMETRGNGSGVKFGRIGLSFGVPWLVYCGQRGCLQRRMPWFPFYIKATDSMMDFQLHYCDIYSSVKLLCDWREMKNGNLEYICTAHKHSKVRKTNKKVIMKQYTFRQKKKERKKQLLQTISIVDYAT
jgi:hypothetical protein